MTKQDIHKKLMDVLSDELANITAAAKSTIDTATDSEHVAKSKYETFGLESSYLARGQAKRVDELSAALDLIKAMSLKPFTPTTPIQVGALVRLTSADKTDNRTLLIAPGGGGEEIDVGNEVVTIVTHISPIGRALLGKKTGQSTEVTGQTFTISSVE